LGRGKKNGSRPVDNECRVGRTHQNAICIKHMLNIAHKGTLGTER
jgi:hypothetical protein